jgi:hypothetical protein
MLADHCDEYSRYWSPLTSEVPKFGMAPDTQGIWVCRAQIDGDPQPGLINGERRRMEELEREARELCPEA